MADSAYSFSLTTFSPSGKLVQIEYALNAVMSGSTSLGVKGKNGVVIATEKKLPSCLIDETTVQKIVHLTENIAVVYSGMGPDFRVLCRKGRKAAQAYYRVYREIIPVAMLVRELAAVMQEFTQQGGVRPFGVSLLCAGFDHNGPQLFQIDPSGSYFAWKASAIGKQMVRAPHPLSACPEQEPGCALAGDGRERRRPDAPTNGHLAFCGQGVGFSRPRPLHGCQTHAGVQHRPRIMRCACLEPSQYSAQPPPPPSSPPSYPSPTPRSLSLPSPAPLQHQRATPARAHAHITRNQRSNAARGKPILAWSKATCTLWDTNARAAGDGPGSSMGLISLPARAHRAPRSPCLVRTSACRPQARPPPAAPQVNAKTFLEKRYHDELELEDAVHTALLTLKEGFEGAMDHTNIEVGIIGVDKKFKVLTPAEIKDYLGEVE